MKIMKKTTAQVCSLVARVSYIFNTIVCIILMTDILISDYMLLTKSSMSSSIMKFSPWIYKCLIELKITKIYSPEMGKIVELTNWHTSADFFLIIYLEYTRKIASVTLIMALEALHVICRFQAIVMQDILMHYRKTHVLWNRIMQSRGLHGPGPGPRPVPGPARGPGRTDGWQMIIPTGRAGPAN